MRLDTGQHMRMSQQMKLAPRMIQSMEILQLSIQALEERIEQELESNVTLETVEPGGDETTIHDAQLQAERDATENERPLNVEEQGGAADDFERLDPRFGSEAELSISGVPPAQARRAVTQVAARVAVRNLRRDAIAHMKELLKKKELEYDEIHAVFAEFGKARADQLEVARARQQGLAVREPVLVDDPVGFGGKTALEPVHRLDAVSR